MLITYPLMDMQPALFPEHARIPGRLITIEPLNRERHAEALWNGLSGEENDPLWLYLAEGPFPERTGFDAYLERKANSTEAATYTIVNNRTALACGLASLMRIDRPNRVIEVGGIHFSAALQRTAAATEAMYLLARYAFENLRYRRYEWKCNALNERSRRAAERLGFSFEGMFRQHMIVKGRNRDTAWYSILDSEWPERKRTLEGWLCPEKFRADGAQKQRLQELRSRRSPCATEAAIP